jgi:hypothetical protein
MTDAAITFDGRYLKAVALAASNETTRTYLVGVQIEYTPATGPLIVATNGHVLLAARGAEPDPAGRAARAKVFIPSHVVKMLKLLRNYTTCTLTPGQDGTWTLAHDDQMLAFKAHPDHSYPEWRRVVPSHTEPGGPAYLDPAYITLMAKAGALVGDATPRFVTFGEHAACPAWVEYSPGVDMFGLIQPMRHCDPAAPIARPEWLA